MGINPITVTALLSTLIFTHPALAETAYQRLIRIADQASSKGDYDTALINYRRAQQASPDGPLGNDSYINQAVSELLEARLQRLQYTTPTYVRYIRIADKAYFEGDHDTAIINYERAFSERPGDHYAAVRIQQSQCIKTKKPATGAQFKALGCPML